MMPSVSVIIPTYNHARFLGQALDSVLAQTVLPHEIIVVDDGSSDDTSEVLAGYGNRIRIHRQENQGVAAARNVGVGLASGDLLTFLDADDRWLPRKLERQRERFLAEPDLGLIHCGVERIDADERVVRRLLDGLEGWVATEMLLFCRRVILGGGSGALIPRRIFREVGGFDRNLSTSADWDLYYRIAAQWRIGFVPEVLMQYRLHGANMHGNIRVMEDDMLRALAKAFRDADPAIRRLRRRSYGNLHTVLAGSFFSVANYRGFVRHALKSLLFTPGNISRYLGYPLRQWRRRRLDEAERPRAWVPKDAAK